MINKEHALLFSIKNLTRWYPQSPSMVFYQINMSIYAWDFLIIQWKSWTWKSSLIKLLMWQYRVPPKMISYKQEDISRFDLDEIQSLRRKLWIIFQDYKLLENHTVAENIAIPLRINWVFSFQYSKKVDDIMTYMDLRKKSWLLVKTLSGWEKQKVALARALIHNPECIIADEPTWNLDRGQSIMIVDTLIDLHKAWNTIVFVTHDQHLIEEIQKRCLSAKQYVIWG